MRDLFLLAILPALLYFMFKRPFIALGMWPWTALFFPNGWVYGAASSIRYNLLIAGVTILTYVFSKHKPKFQLSGLGAMVLLFFVWTTISTIMAIGNQEVAWDYWNRFWKVIALFIFVLLIVEKKLHLDMLLWGVVLSVGFYGNLEALKFIASGGGHAIAGMSGHVLGDRNELAVAFVMTLPICAYLLGEYGQRSRIIQIGLLGSMALLVFAVIGTQSRGGFISMLAVAGYLFVKSKRKFLFGSLAAVLVVAASFVVTSEWTDRINTIETANQDDSFMGRVVAWKLSFILATQNPIFGGGFKALENFAIWRALIKDFDAYSWFYTGDAVPVEFARAAHSVYFQVLGDQGFGGLFIYVTMLAMAFFKAAKVARIARRQLGNHWVGTAASMIQLSIFAFALGGAALSFAYFDLIFTLFALVIVLERRLLPAALAQVAGAGKAVPLHRTAPVAPPVRLPEKVAR
ncbi:putative O-glycosylation ligase, exosortase A system-associated [Massilia sp. IC2-476]|uniref:putative O-glycosylation ligase, exosortase A system-associated n=1 Tax=Massilia sp. IC2-476 TaxID=2887199 RepID=UPI001D1030B8|nr:putative O-glycosylation ligase, exosortase A system-associated [Massilia sp. IC2-476]MCC2973047.1 putative O-glycosylation ligase, exosortase A system-associated [Massilia sp. IC2-476]